MAYCQQNDGGGKLEAKGNVYGHWLEGACLCGVQHGDAVPFIPPSSSRTETKQPSAAVMIESLEGTVETFKQAAPEGFPRVESVDRAYDVDGRWMAVQVRYEPAEPVPGEKRCKPWTLGADGWKMNLRGLKGGGLWFGLREALERAAAPILMVEGPKTMEAAAWLFPDYAVVSPFNGKDSLRAADFSPFKGRRVTLWPDADADQGSQVAFAKAAEQLQAAGAVEVRFVTPPPGLPERHDGWDLANDPPEGLSFNVSELLEKAAVVSAVKQPEEAPPRWPMSSILDLEDLQPIPWLVEDTFREKGFILLYGESGVGKSWAALDLALSIATGTPWGPRETKRGRVLYLTLEDGKAGSKPRIMAWLKARSIPVPDTLMLIEHVLALDSSADVDAFILEQQRLGFSPNLIIFDTLALSTAGIDENAAKDAGGVIGNLKKIQQELEAAVMLVHHAKKEEPRTYRGSSAWMGAVDTMMAVVKRNDGGFIIECTKQRSAPPFNATRWKLEPVPGVMWEKTPMVTTQYESDDLPGMPGNLAGGRQSWTPNRTNVRRVIERLTQDKGGATRSDIRREIDIAPGSLSDATAWLLAEGWVFFDPQRELWHTSRESVPHHRLPPADDVRRRSEGTPNNANDDDVRRHSENTPNAGNASYDDDSW